MDERFQYRRQPAQLDEVQCAELANLVLAEFGQPQPYRTAVLAVAGVPDEARGLGSISQSDGAVVAYGEVVRDFADRWSFAVRMPFHREQQLVLCGAEFNPSRLLFTPRLEAP